MSREFISEAKTKLAHVTACLGLHANMKELEANVLKINHVVRRDGRGLPHMPMFCATALEVCQPAAAVYYPYYRDNPHLFPRFDVVPKTFSDFDAFSGENEKQAGFNLAETPNYGFSTVNESGPTPNTSFDFSAVQTQNNEVSDGFTTVQSVAAQVNDDDW
jgi:hypothetical protein